MITDTLTVNVDDLYITSTSADMIESLTERLKKRYGEMSKTNGTVLNYLGMVFDLSRAGDMGKCRRQMELSSITWEWCLICPGLERRVSP